MKKVLAIALAVMLILMLCVGTAFAKKGENNGKGNSDKPKTTHEVKNDNNKDKVDKQNGKLEAQKKKEAKNAFKAAVTPLLNQIKANQRAWGQAGGLGEIEGVKDDIENMLQQILAGNVLVTPEQLAAISAEIQNIKALKDSLRSDKRLQSAEWKKYITAKKTYDIAAGTAALQNVISIQLKRIEARKGIFSSLAKIAEIVKTVLNTPAPSPSSPPSTSPDPGESQPPVESSAAPSV